MEVPLGLFSDAPPRRTIGYGDAQRGGASNVVVVEGADPGRTLPAEAAATVPASTAPSSESSSASPSQSASARRRAVWAGAAGAPRERYVEGSLLGEGATAEVRVAEDVDIGRRVAIKRLHRGGMRDEMLLREVRIVGGLEHPNIVPIHDVDVDDEGHPYLVMKHVEGVTLESIIDDLRRRDPAAIQRWSIEARIELFLGLLHAIDYAHAHGVLHRDIKPENVMVGPYGEVLLMDWGIALRQAEVDPAGGRLVGTPLFMSPEQARMEPLDTRSDLYSAAVLFHELITLRHYLEGSDDIPTILQKVGHEGWRRSLLDWHRPGPQPMAPLELYHFLRKAMAFDRERRFASAGEMIVELSRILEGRVRIQCHVTLVKSTVRRAGRFVDRRPWLAFFLFLFLVAASLTGLANLAWTAFA